jgi:hypothetical protein
VDRREKKMAPGTSQTRCEVFDLKPTSCHALRFSHQALAEVLQKPQGTQRQDGAMIGITNTVDWRARFYLIRPTREIRTARDHLSDSIEMVGSNP